MIQFLKVTQIGLLVLIVFASLAFSSNANAYHFRPDQWAQDQKDLTSEINACMTLVTDKDKRKFYKKCNLRDLAQRLNISNLMITEASKDPHMTVVEFANRNFKDPKLGETAIRSLAVDWAALAFMVKQLYGEAPTQQHRQAPFVPKQWRKNNDGETF